MRSLARMLLRSKSVTRVSPRCSDSADANVSSAACAIGRPIWLANRSSRRLLPPTHAQPRSAPTLDRARCTRRDG
eukprot:943779-Pleurochrysis_carterae.AAC.1